MSCSGQFCQLGLTVHNAHDSGVPLFGTVPNVALPVERRLSWHVTVLPYREEERVLKQFDLTAAADDQVNAKATSHQFRHIVCPSSGEYSHGRNGYSWKSPTPLTHYVGVAGAGADAATLPVGHPRAGMFGYDRPLSLSKEAVPDGTSNTLMLIETGLNPGHWAFGGPSTVRPIDVDTAPLVGVGRPFGGFHPYERPLFSPNRFMANAAMADGSCHQIRDTIDPAVLAALATTGGNETLPCEW